MCKQTDKGKFAEQIWICLEFLYRNREYIQRFPVYINEIFLLGRNGGKHGRPADCRTILVAQ